MIAMEDIAVGTAAIGGVVCCGRGRGGGVRGVEESAVAFRGGCLGCGGYWAGCFSLAAE